MIGHVEFNNNFIWHLEGYVHRTTEQSADGETKSIC